MKLEIMKYSDNYHYSIFRSYGVHPEVHGLSSEHLGMPVLIQVCKRCKVRMVKDFPHPPSDCEVYVIESIIDS